MQKKLRGAALLSAAMAGAALTGTAWAGEGLFSRLYTTDTVPAGHFEMEQLVRDRSGRASGDFSAYDFKSEFEYGVTDDLQAAFYFNTGHVDAKNAPDDDDPMGATGFTRNNWFVQSVSAEFLYRAMSPYTDGIGLAFALEPEFAFHDLHNGLEYQNTFGIEFRTILQKNFLDDRLVIAYNLVLEMEAIRFKGDLTYASELDWNNELGISYRFAPGWFAGVEVRNHNEYGDFNYREHSVYWAGPVLHYGGEKFWATLGLMEQFYGSPSGVDANGTFIGNGEFLRSHEQHEITLKVGFPF